MPVMFRQVQIRCGSTTLDLNVAPYDVAAGSWSSAGTQLELRLMIQATGLAELQRYTAALRMLLGKASAYVNSRFGDPVYIYSKTCDDLSTTAELGATWLRKQMRSGALVEGDPSENASGRYAVACVLSLEVDAVWRRCQPETVFNDSYQTPAVTARSDGGLHVVNGGVYGYRQHYSSTTGVTVRCTWLVPSSDSDITFWTGAGLGESSDVMAWWNSTTNKFMMQDAELHQASSAAYNSLVAGQAVDLVFKWDPTTPAMKIWVNGVVDGSSAYCTFDLQQVTGSNLVTNGGFETFTGTVDDGTTDTFTGWDNSIATDASNLVEATATKYAGTYALKITRAVGLPYVYQTIAVTPMTKYRLQFYTRGDGTKAGIFTLYDFNHSSYIVSVTTGITGTSFSRLVCDFTAPAGCTFVQLILAADLSGTVYFDAVTLYELGSDPNYYNVASTAGTHDVTNVQIWPTPLTDAQCAGLSLWGVPPAELPFYRRASASNVMLHKLYAVPGQASCLGRIICAGSGAQNYDKLLFGLRPGRVQTAAAWECEDGTLGDQTTSTADANASGGDVAKWDPADATSEVRVTCTIATNPADVAPYLGRYRVYLAGNDNDANVGHNLIKFRPVFGGINGDFSTEVSFGAVSTYSMLELGTLFVPPDAWPEGAENAPSTEVTPFFKIELWTRNDLGSSGGTLDLDAFYLVPDEVVIEIACADWDVTDHYAVLDFCSPTPSGILTENWRTMEFGGWLEVTRGRLEFVPGEASLWACAYRNSAESCSVLDPFWLFAFFMTPGWE